MTRMTKARTEFLLRCDDAAKEPTAYEAFARGWEKALEAASVWMLSAAQEINRVQMGRDHVLKDEFGMKHPVMPVDEQVEIMSKHFQIRQLNEEKECPLCGPDCVGGAHRNVLDEDGVETREQLEALRKQERARAKRESDEGQTKPLQFFAKRPMIMRHVISGTYYLLEAEGVAAEYILALEAVLGEYRKGGGHQSCIDLTQWSFDGRDHRCSTCAKADALLAQRKLGSC